jgi:glycosyltransferase involved in cell wall biosynthesis
VNTTTVTIVTSVLNGAKTFRRCMESVADQTYPCEHIIADAGSTDGTQEIAQSFSSANVKLIDASGTGISEAFNIGIQHASGSLIGILNADDWYERDAVARSVEAMYNHPRAGFSYGSVIIHNENRRILARPVASEKLRDVAVKYMPFCHISSFVRRDIYQRYGMYDHRYRVAMDFDFYARIISQGVDGILVDGLLGNIQSGGVSSSLRRRFPEYLDISSRYLGKWIALRHLLIPSIRGWVYDTVNKAPVARGLLRRINLQTRFVELV